MNNTKWDEIRLAMYGLGDMAPFWRTKDRHNGHISDWDREWFYHFRNGGYDTIEWLEIKTSTPAQREAVLNILSSVHVPGCATAEGFRVFGWTDASQAVNYITADEKPTVR